MAHSNLGSNDPHVVDRLVEYLSGSLTPAQETAVESHLLTCAACRSEYDEIGPIALMVAREPEGSLDDPTEVATADVVEFEANPSPGRNGAA